MCRIFLCEHFFKYEVFTTSYTLFITNYTFLLKELDVSLYFYNKKDER